MTHQEEQRIRAMLAAEAAADGLSTPGRVEQTLRSALRRNRRARMARRAAAIGAIAAALAAGWFLPRAAERPEPVAAIAPAPPRPAPAAAVPAEPTPVLAEVSRPLPARRPGRPSRASQPAAVAAVAPEFIPVGAWQAIEPMERGSIVRVRLPKSSLPGLGIPVSAERWNESIPADVLLGEDGSMRAVRFISAWQ